MENASRALLMAGGILLGILILSLMVTLFASSSSLSKTYDESKQSEAIQKFNTNFTQYVGHELTIHQVVTICNFAYMNGVTTVVNGTTVTETMINDVNGYIKVDVEEYTPTHVAKYKLQIDSYSDDGYVEKIQITDL